jgi:FkbM family methyltransferase
MKKIKGLWFPDKESGRWLDRCSVVDGLPVYQPEALGALVSASKHKRVVVDGGAHVGLWTLQLAKYFDHVVAFEPNQSAAECLQANVDDWGLTQRVAVIGAALGKRKGSSYLFGDDVKSLSWSLKRPLQDVGGHNGQAVFVTTIDEHMDVVDAIKLDVEGFQYDALLGAARTLLEHRPVILMEEKYDDPHWRATEVLTGIGMHKIGRWKRDFLFVNREEEQGGKTE